MNSSRQIAWWLGLFIGTLIIIYLLRPVLLPFVAGMAIAYILDPTCDWLERHRFSRFWATALLTGVFALLIIASAIFLIPLLIDQFTAFLEALPSMADKLAQKFEPFYEGIRQRYGLPELNTLIRLSAEKIGAGIGWTGGAIASLLTQGLALANLLSLIFITPVVSFYLLRDWDHLVNRLDDLLPRNHAVTIRRLTREMDQALAGFARGQASVCLILAIYYSTGFGLAGVPFGIVIGLIAGILTFIPYVGSLTGLALALLASLLSDDVWLRILYSMIVFGIGQALEGNFLTPRLVGKSVGLHPVWIIFALLAFGSLFGFVGLLLAVPAAAAMGVLVRFAIQRYESSRLYVGGE